MRYALEGGKRIRAVICLATAEAAGAPVEAALPAAAAIELVHAFSLVHDDLPALDDDDERRGRPSAHVAFGEGVALLAGDALLAEAFRLALAYPTDGSGARARRRDARDDRRPVPRHHGRGRRPRRAAPAQDGAPLRGIRRARAPGRRGARGGAGAMAGVRGGARAAVPDRRRRPRRGRVRGVGSDSTRRAISPARRPTAPTWRSTRSRRTHRCCERSSPASPSAPPIAARRQASACRPGSARQSRTIPPAGKSPTAVRSRRPPCRLRHGSKNAGACRRPGSATVPAPPGATAAPSRREERRGVPLLVEDVGGDDEIERPRSVAGSERPVEHGGAGRGGALAAAFSGHELDCLGRPVRREHVAARERSRERGQREPAAELEHALAPEVELCQRAAPARSRSARARPSRGGTRPRRTALSSIRLSGSSGRAITSSRPAELDALLSHPASLPAR